MISLDGSSLLVKKHGLPLLGTGPRGRILYTRSGWLGAEQDMVIAAVMGKCTDRFQVGEIK